MKIAIGSDHAGIELKETIKNLLIKEYNHFDVGIYSKEQDNFINNAPFVDYPDISDQVTNLVIQQPEGYDYGILICGTGQGMAMSANKKQEIRAGLCTSVKLAKLARQHNNCNILCLGGRTTGHGVAIDIVDAFLHTKFEGGRHLKRINKFSKTS